MIKIKAIPAFTDNYIWCLYDDNSRGAVVVDPGDEAPVSAALAAHGLHLEAIILTHHHFDHSGGVEALLHHHSVPVYGPANQQLTQVDHPLSDHQHIMLLNVPFTILAVPGHTLDHIAYYCEQLEGHPVLFCGDTLFAGGCGRIFEGDPPMMHASLAKIAQLPPQTTVYCAHEYTLDNLRFAQAVEPHNQALIERISDATQRRSHGLATVPSSLALEKQTNPFLRCNEPTVIQAADQRCATQTQDPVQVFAIIRAWKDQF